MKIKQFIISVLLTFCLLIFSINSSAAPDISGTYSGTFDINVTCKNNYTDYATPDSILITQTGDFFTGSIIGSRLDGATFLGQIDSSGQGTIGSYQFSNEVESATGPFLGNFLSEKSGSLKSTGGTYQRGNSKPCGIALASNNLTRVAPESCPAPQVLDPVTNTCITPQPITCTLPQVLDPTTNTCVTPQPISCTLPQIPDSTGKSCITPLPTCTAPQVLDTVTHTCINQATTEEIAAIKTIQTELPKNIQIIRTTNALISQHLAAQVSHTFSIDRASAAKVYQQDESQNVINPSSDNSLEAQTGTSSTGGDKNKTTVSSGSGKNKAGEEAEQKKSAAPEKQEKSLLDSLWGNTSITDIHQDDSQIANFSTQIYQFVSGVDKRIGDFFLGSAVTYAYSNKNQTGQDATSHVIGITPYGAYQINDYMFLSALAGYNFTHISDNFASTTVHDYMLEANLNFFKILYDSVIVKSRLGSRFHHTFTNSLSQWLDPSTDELVLLGDVELGYRFDNGFVPYIGSSYEHYNREASFQGANVNNGIFYLRGGFDYLVRSNLTIGAKVQADMNDNHNDLISGTLSFRLAF
jgi:hypothetical protein